VDWKIDFDADSHDVTVTTGGAADCAGFRSMNLELVEDDRWRPGMTVLLDHSSLDASALTGSDVEEISRAVVELDERLGPAVCAIVTTDEYLGGLTDVSIRYAAPSRLCARAFDSRDRAVEWLARRRLPAP
jgi:hypothetical protein